MSDDMAPSHLWVTEDGALSHHRPSDHTAVQYTQTSILHSEVERLTERTKERERVWAERERVAMARVAEVTAALQEEQGESLRQAEIARDALTKAERLTALIPDPDDLRTVLDDLKERARVRRLMERDASWPPSRRWLDAYDRLRAALAAEGTMGEAGQVLVMRDGKWVWEDPAAGAGEDEA